MGRRYAGSLVECEGRGARVRFVKVDAFHELALWCEPLTDAMSATAARSPGARSSAVRSPGAEDGGSGGNNEEVETIVPYELLRPLAPPSPSGWRQMLSLGCFVEMASEGGWWEVELLGASAGPLSKIRAAADVDGGVDGDVVGGADGDAAAPAECGDDEADATYTVRLLTAPSETVGVYEVRLEALRPGWQWRSSKWGGMWPRGANGVVTAPPPHDAWPPPTPALCERAPRSYAPRQACQPSAQGGVEQRGGARR